MDLSIILSTIVDFLILLIPLTIICFIVYKILSKSREYLAEKYNLSWTKSCLLLNFLVSFFLFLGTYLYFYFVGATLALPNDPEVEYTILDNLTVLAFATVRMIVAALIISLVLYFFELVASFAMDLQKNSKNSEFTKQLIGITITCALFLILFLFIFNWAFLGMVIYVFYGGIKPLPLII